MKNEIVRTLLRSKDLEILLGVSKSTIWRWRQQSDSCFPAPISLGPRLVFWKLEDIKVWIASNQLGDKAT
jgi:predicted DNA-binding transcriptional regulator AlpA